MQYLSHRSTALDSVYSREEKIDTKIEKLPEFFTDEFTVDNQTLKIEFIKSTVYEDSSWLYRIQKYLCPFSDIQGYTKLGFKLSQDIGLNSGDYKVVGDIDNTNLKKLGLRVMPVTNSLFFVYVNSVEVHEIANAISEIDNINNIRFEETSELLK